VGRPSFIDAAERQTHVAPLVIFRCVFGLLLALGTARLLHKGFVEQAFGIPRFFFAPWPLQAFWRPLPVTGMYAVYAVQVVLACAIACGVRVRIAAAAFCVLFTYTHFIDLTNYLNHYWLVTLLTGLLVCIPADGAIALWPERQARPWVPAWHLWLFRAQIACVYVFAGLAKLNTDWLVHAMPMRVWLAANTDLPLLGGLLRYPQMAYLASGFGAAYDLTIPLWLSMKRTRIAAYVAVIFFHLLTAQLFNIGMFPYFMIAASIVFLDPATLQRALGRLSPPLRPAPQQLHTAQDGETQRTQPNRRMVAAAVYLVVQLLVPLRGHLYPGNLQWHEQGYRFAWRVMLMEKMGSAEFRVVDARTQRTAMIRVRDYLTPQQEKAMATQPDMILQFAHHLYAEQARLGNHVAVYADVFVTLNGRPAKPLIDPEVDLSQVRDGFGTKSWILPE
jgi:Vitamin K-dependent gamma-carboxylase